MILLRSSSVSFCKAEEHTAPTREGNVAWEQSVPVCSLVVLFVPRSSWRYPHPEKYCRSRANLCCRACGKVGRTTWRSINPSAAVVWKKLHMHNGENGQKNSQAHSASLPHSVLCRHEWTRSAMYCGGAYNDESCSVGRCSQMLCLTSAGARTRKTHTHAHRHVHTHTRTLFYHRAHRTSSVCWLMNLITTPWVGSWSGYPVFTHFHWCKQNHLACISLRLFSSSKLYGNECFVLFFNL